MKDTIVIEVDVQTAMSDEKLVPKVVALLTSGEGDIVQFGVSRLVSKSKRRQDAVEIGPMRVTRRGSR